MADPIIGRDQELESLRAFLGVADAEPRVLLLEGEPGIGKTTLWEAALAATERSHRTLTARPAEAEMELSFTGLGDLLSGAAEAALPDLPDPQRRALEVALLLEPGTASAPEQRAVAAGLLGALRCLGQEGPVLVAIDDVQWLDASSATAVAYALRRLGGERIDFLLAQRAEPGASPALGLDRPPPSLRVTRMEVGPLSLAALQRLLSDRLGVLFPRPTLRRIHETSGGNPFYGLELARALERHPYVPGEPLAVPDELRSLVKQRLEDLPPETKTVLLPAALVRRPTVALLGSATASDPLPALDRAVEAGVVRMDGEHVRFLHPLLATAVVDGAGPERRRQTHGALAGLVQEPEQRARHLALAAEGPDESVAAALAQAARAVGARGAWEAAAELAEQARTLTPATPREQHFGRAIDAAWLTWLAGDGTRAHRLLSDAATTAPEGPVRARALERLARVEGHWGDRRAVPELCQAALAQAGGDPLIEAYIHEALAWDLSLKRDELERAAGHARTAVELAEQLDDLALLRDALSVQGQSEFLLGGGLPSAAMDRALEMTRERFEEVGVMRLPEMHWSLMLQCADRLEEARANYERLETRAVAQGDESAMPWILMRLSHVELFAGNWVRAVERAESGHQNAIQAAHHTMESALCCTRALLAAHLGHVEEARSLGEEGLHRAEARGDGIGARLGRWSLGLLALSLGDMEDAERVLGGLWRESLEFGIFEPGENRYAGDLAEALVALGRLDEAAEVAGELERRGGELGRPAVLAVAARCRGLVAERPATRPWRWRSWAQP